MSPGLSPDSCLAPSFSLSPLLLSPLLFFSSSNCTYFRHHTLAIPTSSKHIFYQIRGLKIASESHCGSTDSSGRRSVCARQTRALLLERSCRMRCRMQDAVHEQRCITIRMIQCQEREREEQPRSSTLFSALRSASQACHFLPSLLVPTPAAAAADTLESLVRLLLLPS